MTQTDHPQEHVDLATAVRLTGLSARQIKRWQEMGIIGDSEGRIRFVDLRLLRSLASILTTRLSARRLNRALERLDTPANSLTTDGKSLLHRKHQALWHTETGQGQIDFEAQEQSAHTGTLVKIRHTTRQNEGLETNAEELHDLALSLEPTDPKAAQTAYLKALHQDPEHVPSHINLGRLRQLQGAISGAVRQYREALRIDPNNSEALYNIATVFDDLEESSVAIKYYEKAAREISEAHLHLGRLHEERGEIMRARWHFAIWERQMRKQGTDGPEDPSEI